MRRVKPISVTRRSLLRGAAGVSLSLPWLEIMESKAQGAPSATLPRVIFIYFPTGYRSGDWVKNKTPGSYTEYELPGIAKALDPFKSKLTLITGLSNDPAAVGNGGDGIHARGTGCFLTNEVLQMGGFKTGISADQIIAQKNGNTFCIPSLTLSIPDEKPPTFAEDGYGSVYYNNISFTGPTANVQKENKPKDLFDRLTKCGGFGTAPMQPDPAVTERAAFEKKVMGSVKDEATRLMNCVGQADRIRLQQYYDSVAELERRFQDPTNMPTTMGCDSPMAPAASGGAFFANSKLMMDTALVALKCGLTPVATMMLDGAFSHRNYGLQDIDGVDYVHGLSHGEIAGISADHPRWVKITTHFFEHFAYLLQQMDAVNEGNGTMLDNSIVYISSEFGDGNGHSIKQLPVLIAGGGGGRLNVGRQIAVADNTPSANAILDVMRAAGVDRTTHGNSTGQIPGLSI
jgi:Protein of unknown function (DUF1552)